MQSCGHSYRLLITLKKQSSIVVTVGLYFLSSYCCPIQNVLYLFGTINVQHKKMYFILIKNKVHFIHKVHFLKTRLFAVLLYSI